MLPPDSFRHLMPGGIKRKTPTELENYQFLNQTQLFPNPAPPISWGTVTILLPPVVHIKKNF
jgi:hypothetical protein